MEYLLFSYFIFFVEILIIHSIPNIKRRREIYFYLFFLQFFLLAGFRGLKVHPDTLSYVTHFCNISDKNFFWETEADRFNIGYLILEKFIHKHVSSSALGFNVLTSFIICLGSLSLFYKRAYHFGVAVFLYYVSGEFFSQIGVLRESFAVVVSYFCFYFIENKKLILSIIFIFISISFHSSAIILLILFYLEWKSPSRLIRISFFVLTLVVTYAIAPFMEMILQLLAFETRYYYEGVDRGFASFNGFFNGIVGLTVTYSVYKMILNAKFLGLESRYSTYINILYVYLLISVLTLRLSILSRFLMYFNPFIFILISNLVFVDRKNLKYALLAFSALMGNIVVKQLFRPEWIGIFPYEFYNSSQLQWLLY